MDTAAGRTIRGPLLPAVLYAPHAGALGIPILLLVSIWLGASYFRLARTRLFQIQGEDIATRPAAHSLYFHPCPFPALKKRTEPHNGGPVAVGC